MLNSGELFIVISRLMCSNIWGPQSDHIKRFHWISNSFYLLLYRRCRCQNINFVVNEESRNGCDHQQKGENNFQSLTTFEMDLEQGCHITFQYMLTECVTDLDKLKAKLRHAFSTCVYCIQLCFQSNDVGVSQPM